MRMTQLIRGFAFAAVAAIAASPVQAGEGGTAHVTPGAAATLGDLPPTGPGPFVKSVYMHYSGDNTIAIPTAAGVVANVEAKSNTVGLIAGYGFEQRVLGDAHYGVAIALPYTWLDVSGQTASGKQRIENKVDGFGDLTIIPTMLAWVRGDWQYDFQFNIYAPTGSYVLGRLGNPGLNYWTFDPIVGIDYKNAKTGFNVLAHMGYAMNTENDDTNYRSGNLLHTEFAVQQVMPVGSGFFNFGAEGWWFQQTTCDSGSGATLGCFKGRTAGIGPVLGWVQPLGGKQTLILEAKWQPELEIKNRLEGAYIWLKAVYKW